MGREYRAPSRQLLHDTLYRFQSQWTQVHGAGGLWLGFTQVLDKLFTLLLTHFVIEQEIDYTSFKWV